MLTQNAELCAFYRMSKAKMLDPKNSKKRTKIRQDYGYDS